MCNEPSHVPNDPVAKEHSLVHRRVDAGLYAFLALGTIALLSPHVVIVLAGVYWAALFAVILLVLWFSLMQTTCMNGGRICSLVAMMVLVNTVAIVLAASLKYLIQLLP